jgi:predicted nuclease of restriction endonuclease-like (RecB) superfamily
MILLQSPQSSSRRYRRQIEYSWLCDKVKEGPPRLVGLVTVLVVLGSLVVIVTNAVEPADYALVLADLKDRVRSARFTAQRRANTELVHLYWRIGHTLLQRGADAAWGSGLLEQLANDLRSEFPAMKGFSVTNLKYMRQLATAWSSEEEFGQQLADQLPWGHLMILLGRLDTHTERVWYAQQSVTHGWSRNVLERHIRTHAITRFEAASTDFTRVLEPTDSDLAQQIVKDPYVLDFLRVGSDANERDIEQALVDHIIRTLQELGAGFSFVGRQVHFDVDGDDFYVDLLFFHIEQLRYIVVELKTGKFKPEHAGQLGFYVALVDDKLRRPQHAPTVGLLLVTSKSDAVVRYALAGSSTPVAIASYDLLPAKEKASLPSEAQLARALAPLTDQSRKAQ